MVPFPNINEWIHKYKDNLIIVNVGVGHKYGNHKVGSTDY